jgi:hypothetical protein
MSTWQEIREEILVMLDVKKEATTSSDIRSLVDVKLKRVRDRLYNLKFPRSLLVSSSDVTVDSTTLAIKLTGSPSAGYPSFQLSNFLKLFGLTIRVSTETEGEDLEFVEWPTWIRSKSTVGGDQRPDRSFTLDYQDYFYLWDVPSSGESWLARLHYYKTPATITDGGTPEIGSPHEELLAVAVAVQFPNLFKSQERLAIYADLRRHYGDLLKDYLRDKTSAKRQSRMRPFIKKKTEQSVLWGTGETGP